MISLFKDKLFRIASLITIAGSLSIPMAQPAAAQSNDAWKSAAIIGGSTIAGAVIGGKVAGSKGALIGGAAGATTGYVIDRHRRQNEYNNYYGENGNNGPYDPNGYYSGNNNGYYGQDTGYYPSNDNGYDGNNRGKGTYDRYGNYYPSNSNYGHHQH